MNSCDSMPQTFPTISGPFRKSSKAWVYEIPCPMSWKSHVHQIYECETLKKSLRLCWNREWTIWCYALLMWPRTLKPETFGVLRIIYKSMHASQLPRYCGLYRHQFVFQKNLKVGVSWLHSIGDPLAQDAMTSHACPSLMGDDVRSSGAWGTFQALWKVLHTVDLLIFCT